MTTLAINDSLSTFTQRMPSAYVGSEQWYLHDIIRWRHFYRSHILAREAVDRIPDDTFRKGYTWGGATPEQINLLTETERRLNVRLVKKRALTFSRLDGEAYIYMDNGEASDLPLDPERVRKDGLRFINMLRVDDLVKGPITIDPMSPYYMMPQWYQVISSNGEMVQIHPSRMAKFIRNQDPTTFLGISDLALLYEPITMLERAEENVSELTTEARIDVMGVQGLMDAVQDPELEAQIVKRYALAADLKRTNKMLVIDKEKEEYNQKQTQFSGLPDVIESYRRGYCAATKIAYALVFGRHGGLGSNGETDLITYYDNIATIQRTEVSDPCYILNECIIRSALGNRPDELFIDWLPLHEVSEKERVENAVKVADAVDKLVKSQALPADILTQPTVNWLTELGTFQGLEQAYNEWEAGGGVLDGQDDESDVIRPEPKIEEDVKVTDESPERRNLWDRVNAIINRRTNS